MHAAAGGARSLADVGGDARVLQRERRIEPCDASADDRDPSLLSAGLDRCRQSRHRSAQSRGAHGGAPYLEKVAAADAHLTALLLHRLDGAARALSLVEILAELLETAQQRGAGHVGCLPELMAGGKC